MDIELDIEFWAAMAMTALASAGFSGWFVRRRLLRSFAVREKRIVAALSEKDAAARAKLCAALERSKHEMEQLRSSISKQIAAAVVSSKTAISRLEGRLQLAYSELDHLRERDGAIPAPMRNLANAFAPTEALESRV
jgi:hypothetical protein